MNINFGVRFSVILGSLPSCSWRGKEWADLKDKEWDEALAESPYIQARGDLHISLFGAFGGFFEHFPTPRGEVITRLAEYYFPIHQVYRWLPPLGSKMFDGYKLGSKFLEGIYKDYDATRPIVSVKKIVLIEEKLGFNGPSTDETSTQIGLELSSRRQVLLSIAMPRPGDGRYERVPWLAAVIEPPFNTGVKKWDEIAQAAWQNAWSQE